MTKKLVIIAVVWSLLTPVLYAQKKASESSPSSYGHTLNLALGLGYYGGFPLSVNYEFDVAKNFTLAPFISIYSYGGSYGWGNPYYPYRKYKYRYTFIPIGVKGTYYFDELFKASEKWDFYGALSLGIIGRTAVWEDGYYGDRYIGRTSSLLYVNAHIGAEYHFNEKVGMFLDLSTGMSTLGLSIKTK